MPILPKKSLLHVLVVEDESIAQKIYARWLAAENCQATIAEGGVKALHHLHKQHFDLIILDIHLPDINGLKLADMISNSEIWKNIPIIGVTAHVDTAVLDQAQKAGMREIIQKPITASQFQTVLAKYRPE